MIILNVSFLFRSVNQSMTRQLNTIWFILIKQANQLVFTCEFNKWQPNHSRYYSHSLNTYYRFLKELGIPVRRYSSLSPFLTLFLSLFLSLSLFHTHTHTHSLTHTLFLPFSISFSHFLVLFVKLSQWLSSFLSFPLQLCLSLSLTTCFFCFFFARFSDAVVTAANVFLRTILKQIRQRKNVPWDFQSK